MEAAVHYTCRYRVYGGIGVGFAHLWPLLSSLGSFLASFFPLLTGAGRVFAISHHFPPPLLMMYLAKFGNFWPLLVDFFHFCPVKRCRKSQKHQEGGKDGQSNQKIANSLPKVVKNGQTSKPMQRDDERRNALQGNAAEPASLPKVAKSG